VNCDEGVKDELLSVQDMIRERAVKGNFSLPENLHLTLVFIGETPEEKTTVICSAIKRALTPVVTRFSLTFTTAGFFRHSNKDLWWIGPDRGDMSLNKLVSIRKRIADELLKESVTFDNRSFNPHITLGREIRLSSPIVIPKQEIIYPVNRISLMKSHRIGGKLTYSEIFGADLGK